MSNRRREPVSYRPFRTQPLLADGLLPVVRPGGELETQVGEAFFSLARRFGEDLDKKAEHDGTLAGEQAGLATAPSISVQDGSPRQRVDAVAEAGSKGSNDRARQAMAYFRSRGLSQHAAAGIVGNLMAESRLNTSARNKGDGRDGRDSIGIGQWNGDRARALHSFAQNAGKAATDFETQLAFVLHELDGSEKSAGQRLRSARTVEEATAAMIGYERPAGWSDANPRGGHNWSGRLSFANQFAGAPAQSTAPSSISVSGGGRPTGGNSTFDRAYDKSFTRTYLTKVDAEIRRTTGALAEKYRDDPATMEKAFGALKGELKKEHIYPEIMADFDIGFDRMAGGYLEQARGRARDNQAKADLAQFRTDTESLATEQARKLAGFDPKDGVAADMIAADQAAIDAHFDQAAARGVIDADDAQKSKSGFRRETALRYYEKQADAASADDVAAMRAEMAADFADGGLPGLDGEGWGDLDRKLAAMEKQKRGEANTAAKKLRDRGDDMAGRLLQGVEVNQGELTQLMLDSGNSAQGKEQMAETMAKISAGRAIRDLPLADGRAYVEGLRKQYGDTPTESDARKLGFAATMYEQKRKALAADPVSWAEKNGIVEPTGHLAEATDADQIAGIVSARSATAAQAAQELGVTARFLKSGEARALAEKVKADPASGAAIAGAIVSGAGQRAPLVLAEFGADAPMIADAGAIMAFDGSPAAAEDAIGGYGKGSDGRKLTGIKPALATELRRTVTGNALALASGDAGRIERTAAAIARKRMSDQGLDADSDDAAAIYETAVQEAAGAVFDRGVQYGGFTTVNDGWFADGVKVLAPNSIRADMFGDVLGAITHDDLAALAQKPKARSLRLMTGQIEDRPLSSSLLGATPVAVSGGYVFALGDPASDDPQFVQGSDGKVFVLDLMALREKLEPRTVGAWR